MKLTISLFLFPKHLSHASNIIPTNFSLLNFAMKDYVTLSCPLLLKLNFFSIVFVHSHIKGAKLNYQAHEDRPHPMF